MRPSIPAPSIACVATYCHKTVVRCSEGRGRRRLRTGARGVTGALGIALGRYTKRTLGSIGMQVAAREAA